MAPVINYLIRIKRIKVLQRGNELIDPLFRIIDEEKFEKIKDLKAAEVQIYEIIEESGSSGIWIRDIKTALGNAIHTNQVQKHLRVQQVRHHRGQQRHQQISHPRSLSSHEAQEHLEKEQS